MNLRGLWIVAFAGLFSIAASARLSASPEDNGVFRHHEDLLDLGANVNDILAKEKDKSLSSLTVGELTALLDRISIAQQQYLWIRKSERLSLALPGLGQLENGDGRDGALYLTGSILLFAGTVVGAYFALPSNLQFSSINYFTDNFSNIHNAWSNHSFVDYLPSIGVLLGGVVLQAILRGVSSDAAGKLARQRIKDGQITFQPEPFLVMPGAGQLLFRPGVGMNMR